MDRKLEQGNMVVEQRRPLVEVRLYAVRENKGEK